MSQPQPQQQKTEAPPARPRIARLNFVNAISFAGTINSATSDPGLAAVSRQGSGIDICPAVMDVKGPVPFGPQHVTDGRAYDGFLLSKVAVDRTGAKVREVRVTTFVPKENVSEVALND